MKQNMCYFMIYLLVNHQKIKFNWKIKNAIHDCNDEHNFEFLFYKNAANLLFIGTGLRSDLRKSAMRGKFSILLINSTKLGNFPINSGDNFWWETNISYIWKSETVTVLAAKNGRSPKIRKDFYLDCLKARKGRIVCLEWKVFYCST